MMLNTSVFMKCKAVGFKRKIADSESHGPEDDSIVVLLLAGRLWANDLI